MTLYNGIAASQHQFEEGFAEAQRIGQEAQAVYRRAFGREAKALARARGPRGARSRAGLRGARRSVAATGRKVPGRASRRGALIAEQRIQTRRRVAGRPPALKPSASSNWSAATDAALRQGLLDDARDCLRLLGREFPAEADRVAPLHDRLDHRVRAANDAAARRIMLQASDSRAAATSTRRQAPGSSRRPGAFARSQRGRVRPLVGGMQSVGPDRWPRTPAVLVHPGPRRHPPRRPEFRTASSSSRPWEWAHTWGRVVSAADREGAVIVSRARTFRAAELPSELGTAWYGRSYVTHSGATAVPVRH